MGRGLDYHTGVRSHAERFMEQVERQPFKCWPWRGSIDSHGYGQFRIGGRVAKAHRVMFEIVFGQVPDKKVVMHSCDVRSCVNPMHLRAGTPAEMVSHMTYQLAVELCKICPPGRNLSLALIDLESVRMRANAAIAVDDPRP